MLLLQNLDIYHVKLFITGLRQMIAGERNTGSRHDYRFIFDWINFYKQEKKKTQRRKPLTQK